MLIKSYQTITKKTDLSTDGYYLTLRQLATAGDIFIDYKINFDSQFAEIVFERKHKPCRISFSIFLRDKLDFFS